MGLFDKTKIAIPSFGSRSEAFDYLFAKLVEDGVDAEEAASRANSFAETVAKNKKLPAAPEKPKTTIEQGVAVIQQIVSVKRDYPEVWDLVTGAIGGIIGGFAATSINEDSEPKRETIDFEKLE